MLNSLVVMRWTSRMPVNPTHTIEGTWRVGWVLGEGGVSLASRVCSHASCGGTSADDSGSFVMVFKHGGYFFQWKAHQEHLDLETQLHAQYMPTCGYAAKAGSSPYKHCKILPPHRYPLDALSSKISNLKGVRVIRFYGIVWFLFSFLHMWNQSSFFSWSSGGNFQCSPYPGQQLEKLYLFFGRKGMFLCLYSPKDVPLDIT